MQSNCVLKLSFFEIYNDFITDLLEPEKGRNLKIKEMKSGVTVVEGLSERQVTSTYEAMSVYNLALRNRKCEQTAKNFCSSRSHAVF